MYPLKMGLDCKCYDKNVIENIFHSTCKSARYAALRNKNVPLHFFETNHTKTSLHSHFGGHFAICKFAGEGR